MEAIDNADTTMPVEVEKPNDVTMDMVLAKIEEMTQISRWLQKHGKQYIRKNTRGPKRRNVGTEKSEKSKSGFAVPVTVSENLATFLGVTVNDQIPRTEVTKRLTAYIKEHDLQVVENRKNFTVDEALANIFNVPTGTTTNWFEMQKFLSHLLVTVRKEKTDKTTASTSSNTDTNTDINTLNKTAVSTEVKSEVKSEVVNDVTLPKKKKIKRQPSMS